MISRLAVIDLGSNTFHLLIAFLHEDGSWSTLLKDRRYVKLASGGLEYIDRASIDRAVPVMQEFAQHVRAYQVEEVKAIGTAALREAKNGKEVIDLLERESGIPIDIIDGQREAHYILSGIQSVLPVLDEPNLIMDIGGGSVEFILYKEDEILFAQSFKIGVAVLHQAFHQSDPISKEAISKLFKHVSEILTPLEKVIHETERYSLTGASGSFEVIQDAMPKIHQEANWSELSLDGLEDYMSEVIIADWEGRSKMPEIPVERLDYVVVAYLLIWYVMLIKAPSRLFYCDYALKEGVIAEFIQENLDKSK